MPKPTDEAQDLTKDFSDSPLHRFRVRNIWTFAEDQFETCSEMPN